MNIDEMDIFLSSVDRFMKVGIASYIDAMDLYPQKDRPFDVYDRLIKSGVMNIEEMGEELHNPCNIVRLLFTISEYCAGIGAFVGYTLAGEMLKKRYAPELVNKGTVGICVFEERDINIEYGKPDFHAVFSNGVVNGTKKSIIMGGDASFYAVFTKGEDGYYLAWIDRHAKNMKLSQPAGLLGIRTVSCIDAAFEATPVISGTKDGLDALLYTIAILSLFNSACAYATAGAGLKKAWEYTEQRYQGGWMIENYDAIKLMYSKNKALIESSKTAILSVADNFETSSSKSMQEFIRVKISATENAVKALLDAIQMHGGYGYMRDYGIEKRFRDAVTLSLLPVDNTRLSLMLTNLVRK